MLIDYLFQKINSNKTHPYYYLSPHAFAIGNCAEELYYGLIKAKNLGKKIFILYTFDIPFLFKYKLTNKSLFSIDSDYIYRPNNNTLFIVRFLLTIVYIPLRIISLIVKKLFNIKLAESYSYPGIGIYDLYLPNDIKSGFSFDQVSLHNWGKEFSYVFDFTIGELNRSEIFSYFERMGIPNEAWFVCLHVRESGFRKDKGRREYRNSDILNYIPAIKEIVKRGGWVVRIGDNSMKPLPAMKNVIDYPFSKYKSDLMDLLLIKYCKFYIGCQSGTFDVAKLFNKPILLLNMYNWTFGGPLHNCDRGILKHIYSKEKKAYLSIKELFSGGWDTQNINGVVEDYVFVENTDEEILDAVVEYLDCVENKSFPVSKIQITSAHYIKQQAYKIFKNERLAPSNVMNDKEELRERFRIASHVEGLSGYISNSYLLANWEHDALMRP